MLRRIQSFRGNFAKDSDCETYIISSGFGDGENGDIIPTKSVYYNTQTKVFRWYDGAKWDNLYQPKIDVSDEEAWGIQVNPNGKLILKNTKTGSEIVHVAEGQPMTPGSVLQVSKLIRNDTGLEQLPSGMIIKWSDVGRTRNKWLKGSSGVPSVVSGEVIARNAYLIGLSVVVRRTATFSVRIRKEGGSEWITTLNVENGRKGILNNLSVSLNAGDELQCYLDGNVQFPIVTAEIIWR